MAAINDAFARYHKSMNYTRPVPKKRRPRKVQKLQEIVLTVVGLAVLTAIAAGIVHLTNKPKLEAASNKPVQLNFSQKQQRDVNTIGGAIGQYTAANGGVLPTHLSIGVSEDSLVMCNAVCDPTTSQISALSTYKAENVKLMTYVADLAAPDEKTIYLVPGATCKDKTTLGPPSANVRSMVLLYAGVSGNTISQRCVKL